MENNSPKPKTTAIKAIILHTFGVQVGFRVQGAPDTLKNEDPGALKSLVSGAGPKTPCSYMSYSLNSLKGVL